jgi:hypothetical protein
MNKIDTTTAAIERMCQVAPFADNDAGIPEMVAALRALATERDSAEAEVTRLAGRLRMIVSHATSGRTTGEGLSTNDIAVAITASRNDLWATARKSALEELAKEFDLEAAKALGTPSHESNYTAAGYAMVANTIRDHLGDQ